MKRCAAVFALVLGFAAAPASAELEQDRFEPAEGKGRGSSRADALEQAKREAVASKLFEFIKEKGFPEYSEDRVGVRDVLAKSGGYVGLVEVVKEGVEKPEAGSEGSKGPKKAAAVYAVEIKANVNVTRLERDFWEARRIAALRRFGEGVGVALTETVSDGANPSEASWTWLASIGAERQFMTYKFRPVPMAPIRERVKEEAAKGASLRLHEDFRLKVVEEIAAAGGYLRIVGEVALAPAPDVKDPLGKWLRAYTATWWAQLHVGDPYHRKVGAESDSAQEKALKATGTGKTDEEAREAAWKAAGEALAVDLADKLAASLERAKEVEGEPREVLLILESVPDGGLKSAEGEIHKIEGIVSAARLRFGGGRLVMTLTTTLDLPGLREALVRSLGPKGYALDTAAEDRMKFRFAG
ncbi:MAG: hypothetical protein MUC63_02860 [Planctomycetes bacterium]|jgi:hypothetical protein|nr:hypothetical protein [Planctomycetota bacterium]